MRRPSTGTCGHCEQPISLVTWTTRDAYLLNEPVQERRAYAHDATGSIDSTEGGWHTAWRRP